MFIRIHKCNIILVLLLHFLIINVVKAQNKLNYFLFRKDSSDSIKYLRIKNADSININTLLLKIVDADRKKGNVLASIDSNVQKKDSIIFYYSRNKNFKSIEFYSTDSIPIDIKISLYKKKFISAQEWLELRNNLIRNDLYNGYPLTKVSLIPDVINNDSLSARVAYERGPYFTFGEIEQRNGNLISNSYLYRLLNFKVNHPFNQKVVNKISIAIAQLPYLESQYQPRINFFGDKATVYLYLKKKPANSFDFLLGFNNKFSGSSKSVQITGQASFDLNNALKIGERLLFHYENLQENSPSLKILTEFPYLKYLPFGIGAKFESNKYQEDYIFFKSQASFKKIIGSNEAISLVFGLNSSYLLNIDTNYIIRENNLPASLDFKLFNSGFAYSMSTINSRLSPTSGIQVYTMINIGSKTYKKNPSILNFDVNNQLNREFDSLNKNNLQSNFILQFAIFKKLTKRQVLHYKLNSDVYLTRTKILINELDRIGGIHTLRGYNDNNFVSNAYWLSTFEYRFLLDKSSFLTLFVDHSYMRVVTTTGIVPWQNYFGFGIGSQFLTKAGNFGIFFAVNKQANQGIDYLNPKLHFGYTNLF